MNQNDTHMPFGDKLNITLTAEKVGCSRLQLVQKMSEIENNVHVH